MGWNGNDKIFRTYMKGNDKKGGKAAAESHRGKDHVRSFEDAAQFNSFGAVLHKDWKDISFDDPEMSDAFLDIAEKQNWRCLVLENPNNNHIHTFWYDPQHKIKKDGKDIKLACGLVADIHGGETYIPLQVLGTKRFPPIYDILENEDYAEELPEELIPVDTNIKLWKAGEGDGRNNDLFGYILVLQSQCGLSEERIREMYRNVINPYILKHPLPEEELTVILRDDSFKAEIVPTFFDDGKFLFDEFAKFMIQKLHIIQMNNQLFIYDDNTYICSYKLIKAKMIEIIPNLRKTQRNEALEYMELYAPEKIPADARYIAFENGIYDVVENVLMDFTPELIVPNKIHWNYIPDAYSELMDKTLNKLACDDPEIRSLLEEETGYQFYRKNELGKCFINTGKGANGKSTIEEVWKTMLGEDNISALDIGELADRFSTAMMFGKLANIGDDISDDFLQGNAVSIFKKVVTGNRIKAERKGQDPFEFNPYVKLLFSANDIPRMKDKTGAVLRRLVIVPFNARFTEQDADYDPWIKEHLQERGCVEYLIRLGVEGLRRVIQNRGFTTSQKVVDALREYEMENNPIVGFIAENELDSILNQSVSDIYARYQVFCNENGMSAMSRVVFSKQLSGRLGLETIVSKINGKCFRIYRKV